MSSHGGRWHPGDSSRSAEWGTWASPEDVPVHEDPRGCTGWEVVLRGTDSSEHLYRGRALVLLLLPCS